jgi:hypothetical protein
MEHHVLKIIIFAALIFKANDQTVDFIAFVVIQISKIIPRNNMFFAI